MLELACIQVAPCTCMYVYSADAAAAAAEDDDAPARSCCCYMLVL